MELEVLVVGIAPVCVGDPEELGLDCVDPPALLRGRFCGKVEFGPCRRIQELELVSLDCFFIVSGDYE